MKQDCEEMGNTTSNVAINGVVHRPQDLSFQSRVYGGITHVVGCIGYILNAVRFGGRYSSHFLPYK
jgi:hypothetical protein